MKIALFIKKSITLRLDWLLIVLALITVSCGKPKPFCGEKCLLEKLSTFNQVARLYIDGQDFSEEYLSTDSAFKEILYYSNNTSIIKDQKEMDFGFGFKWKNALTFGTVARFIRFDLSRGKKRIIQEDAKFKSGDPGYREYILCGYSIPDSSGKCHYIPYRNIFLNKDVSEIYITEITDDYITWEYDYNGHQVKVVFNSK